MVSGLLATLRVRMFMPHPDETKMDGKPGWQPTGAAQRNQLDTVASTFMTGLREGLVGEPAGVIAERLEQIDVEFRGFAYEGAAMGLAVTDSISPRPRRVREFLEGPAERHVYMAYIGVGWGMARIPRMRWRAVLPRDQVLHWLTLDGLGFHQAFFHTERYVTHKWRPAAYPGYPADAEYVHRAVDQGIGRALWFVNGANPAAAAACIGGYPESRQADLWSGVGLASVYAGGVGASELATLGELAGPYRPELAQGAVFAAKTRHMTELVTPHSELALKTHCEMTVEEAAALTDRTRLDLPPDAALPAYEVWRQRIMDHFRD